MIQTTNQMGGETRSGKKILGSKDRAGSSPALGIIHALLPCFLFGFGPQARNLGQRGENDLLSSISS